MVRKTNTGRVTIMSNANVWPHELLTAKALSKAGHTIEFRTVGGKRYTKTPDILMNGESWEIKSPTSYKLAAVERNLKKAYRQSPNIVFDSRRMGKLPDTSIQKELKKQFSLTGHIKNLLFINRKREVIDISKLD